MGPRTPQVTALLGPAFFALTACPSWALFLSCFGGLVFQYLSPFLELGCIGVFFGQTSGFKM